MPNKRTWAVLALLLICSMTLGACATPATPAAQPTQPPAAKAAPTTAPAPGATPAAGGDFVFGLVLVGPYNDHGWSQAHYEAGKYVEGKIPGSKMIYVDNVNPAASPA